MTLQHDPAAEVPADTARANLSVELSWTSVVVAGVSSIAMVAVWGAVGSASSAVMMIVLAMFLSMALDPIVNAVSHRIHLPRGWTTAVILTVAVVLTGLFIGFAGPQLLSRSSSLEHELPATIASMDQLPLVGDQLAKLDLADRLHDLLAALPDKVDRSGSQVGDVLRAVSADVGAVVLCFLLIAGALLEGPRLIGDIRRAVPPRRRGEADEIGRTVYAVLARYFAGSLLVALLNGVWVACFALVAGVPLSPVLGVWAALTCLIPQIGGLLGFVVVVVVSLTAGLVPTLIMAAAFLAFMLLNNHLLNPMIVGHSVSLSAPVTMIAAIAGFSVAGVVGALVAVPTFGAIKSVAQLYRGGAGSTPDAPHDAGRNRSGGPGSVIRRLRHRHEHTTGQSDRTGQSDPSDESI